MPRKKLTNAERYITSREPLELMMEIKAHITFCPIICITGNVPEQWHTCSGNGCRECVSKWLGRKEKKQ